MFCISLCICHFKNNPAHDIYLYLIESTIKILRTYYGRLFIQTKLQKFNVSLVINESSFQYANLPNQGEVKMKENAELEFKPEPDTLNPIDVKERVQVIDVLRGIAVLGILLMNMKDFSFPTDYTSFWDEMHTGTLDQGIRLLLRLFAEGKFYTLFSFLFGLGMAVMLVRSKTSGRKFTPLYMKRLFVLLIIGFVHDIFIWNGLILIDYAILGFVLLLFQNRKQKTILIWMAVLYFVPLLLAAAFFTFSSKLDKPEGPEAIAKAEAASDSTRAINREKLDQQLELFGNGGYLDMVEFRMKEAWKPFAAALGLGWYVLLMFLAGYISWQKGWFQDINKHKPVFKKAVLLGLLAGIAGSFLYIIFRAVPDDPSQRMRGIGYASLLFFGNPGFCLFYISGLTLLLNKIKWNKFIAALAAVGRTALSNYILQSIIGSLIFYSYGLGMFGKTSPIQNLLLTFAVFAVQLPVSVWWLSRFRFGPVEWLWRSLTYGRMQPMVKEKN